MTMRPTSKVTELGLIPKEWEVKRIGELGSVVRGGSPRPAGDPRYFNGSFIPWLTVAALTNIPEHQLEVIETASGLTAEGAQHSRTLVSGTVIIANSGATLGVAKVLGITCCANDGIAAITNQHAGDKSFVCHYINTRTNYLREVVATGNGQPNLNTTLIRGIPIPFPPLAEQTAIAEALSDVDALLAGLDRLIAKKRDLKEAAVQQLLTGQTRLPGFHGEWVMNRLGDTASLKARIGWQGLTTAEYLDSGEFFLVTGTEFQNGYIEWRRCHFVDEVRYKQDTNIQLRPHDVLVTKDGTIGKVALVPSLPGPATLNSGVFVIRPLRNSFHPEFFYYVLCSRQFSEFLSQLAAGSTISHLYQKDFVSFAYRGPASLEEQAAIAKILADMDAELTTLEARRNKTRTLKQGMMQELLTGRTRLV